MSLFEKLFGRSSDSQHERALSREWTTEGVALRFSTPLVEPTVDAMNRLADGANASDVYFLGYLNGLVSDSTASLTTDSIVLPWEKVYELRQSADHVGCLELFDLPREAELFPILDNVGSLTDTNFQVRVVSWASKEGEVRGVERTGGIARIGGEDVLLSERSWRAAREIEAAWNSNSPRRTQRENELCWGAVRPFADAANAMYRGHYLQSTYVLTPKTLRLPLTRESSPFGSVVTVQPTFDGAPEGWLEAFDSFRSVRPHYDLAPAEGPHVRVVLSEKVQRVLSVIKREMPARRVAGAGAARFFHNPWAVLGDDAQEVILETQFAEDRAGAGPTATTFALFAKCDQGRIERVFLDVTEQFNDGSIRGSNIPFADPAELGKFTGSLAAARADAQVQFAWNEYDLTLDGTSEDQQRIGEQILAAWIKQPAQAISLEDIYELSGYSSRIAGIGAAKPIYVPVMQAKAKEDDGGWVPSDLTPMVRVTLGGSDGQIMIPLTRNWVDEFTRKVEAAEESKTAVLHDAALPTPVSTAEARTLVDGFRAMLRASSDTINKAPVAEKDPRKLKPETLLVKTNFNQIDYIEERKKRLELPEESAGPALPKSLRSTIELRKHQLRGVGWLEHLVRQAPTHCRGAVLADDMGLGKTLQLLIVLAKYYEERQSERPTLILVPKSLLRNWVREAEIFFDDSFPTILALYDQELDERKQPRSLIDQQLQEKGITDLLKPDWVGDAKIVVTTYEVLLRFEFSFAKVPFAFVVCDEAQRIKTPGTFISNAVRALKADFRIVCTGTPVENSLADLWCLFDFVQPGLLGGLSDFSGKYRKPIECDPGNKEQADTVLQLQDLIAPQVLRRTKAELKGEFKKKYFAHRKLGEKKLSFREVLQDGERFEIPMSSHQNVLYLGGLKKLEDAIQESDTRRRVKGSFDALHLMKAVCAEPYCIPGRKFLPDKSGTKAHLANSIKLAEVMAIVGEIQRADEKAIIFTELREIQSCLYYFLNELFRIRPSIINGDSENRQDIIDAFSRSTGFNVIVLSTLAAGAGLNVTAANHVFHFTRAWNPAKENQATDRAYRIGQKKDVFVYCPVTVASDYVTFDVRLDELLRRKARLANTTLGDSSLAEMLNGSGPDVSPMDLAAAGIAGKAMEERKLTMDDIDRFDGFSFEVLCKLLWDKSGFMARVTPKRGGDGGIDVYAIRGRAGELLQCKSSAGGEIGWDAVKEVVGGTALYQSRIPGTVFQRVAVTNQRFNARAREQAAVNEVRLVERADLDQMLVKSCITNIEFDAEAALSGSVFQERWGTLNG